MASVNKLVSIIAFRTRPDADSYVIIINNIVPTNHGSKSIVGIVTQTLGMDAKAARLDGSSRDGHETEIRANPVKKIVLLESHVSKNVVSHKFILSPIQSSSRSSYRL
jgi:hypothetical protein